MKTYETEIDIKAEPARVWKALTQEMPRNPKGYGILRFDGVIAPGAKIKLWSEVSPNRPFALRVTTFDAPHKMVWKGGMPFGLFVGTRTFSITPSELGSRFQMKEVFWGPMAGLMAASIPDLAPSFDTFASSLKQGAEQDD